MKKHAGVAIGLIITILLWIFFVIVARHAPHVLLVGAFTAGIIGFLISIGIDKLLGNEL